MNVTAGNIVVILGHPDSTSFCGALARSYADGARAVGATVREITLGNLSFDPVLRHGYAQIQPLEPDLVAAQGSITWADTLVFVYPTWWGAVPAVLKGFIDRTFLPGFAFNYRENSRLWDRLLAGRSARLLVTMDSPPWYYRWVMRQPGHQMMRRATLGFSGVKPVRTSEFGSVRRLGSGPRSLAGPGPPVGPAGWLEGCQGGAQTSVNVGLRRCWNALVPSMKSRDLISTP
jgi:NAD(P)H dehydrogenase (quinone)